MFITGREACRVLEDAGLSRRRGRQVLDCGLVRAVERGGWADAYRAEEVRGLAAREVADAAEVGRACPQGLFVARRALDLRLPHADQRDVVGVAWPFSPLIAVWLRRRVEQHGSFPLVATIGGFVVLGADAVGVVARGGAYDLELTPPTAWFSVLEDMRFEAGPGRPWTILGLRRAG